MRITIKDPHSRGFTFIELMVCLAILAVLSLVATPTVQVMVQRQKERQLRLALIEIRGALDAYKTASEQGRIMLKPGDSGYPPNLRTLVDGVVDQKSPITQRMYFLRRIPADPFHIDGAEIPEQSWGLRSYSSPPDDPKAGDDVFDVFSRSSQVGLNGAPYSKW